MIISIGINFISDASSKTIEIINAIAKGNNAHTPRIVPPVILGIDTFINNKLKIMQNPTDGIVQRGNSLIQPTTNSTNIEMTGTKKTNPERYNGSLTLS